MPNITENPQYIPYKLLSGGLSAACVRTLEAPFERVKLLLQNQNMISQHNRYRGIIDTFSRVYNEQGLLSFWRGNAINCLRVVPTYALRFTFMDYYQQLAMIGYNGRTEDLPLWMQGLSGALAGFTTMLIVYPLDLIRTQLSVNTSSATNRKLYNGIFDCIIQKNGFQGLYRGLLISLIEITPYTALTLGGYEFVKTLLPKNKEFTVSWYSMFVKFGCAWVSGLCGSFICYPLDTVKRQMMLDGAAGFKSKYNNSILKCFTILYREGGIRTFYSGCLINVLKSAPATALIFVVNDLFKAIIIKSPTEEN